MLLLSERERAMIRWENNNVHSGGEEELLLYYFCRHGGNGNDDGRKREELTVKCSIAPVRSSAMLCVSV